MIPAGDMRRMDFHNHTVYSDGADIPEDVVRAALQKGLTAVGISDHAYTAFDPACGFQPGTESAYRAEIARLKEAYRGRIEVLCGIEQDYYATRPAVGYDYVIGSVHYVKCGGCYLSVDETAAMLEDAVQAYFGGDVYALIEAYYATVADVVQQMGADLIGHFDLVTKFQEQHPLFDEHHPRYVAAWQSAADTLLKTGVPFEINTGAIAKGYRTTPYPSPEIQRYLAAHGGTFRLSSDSHKAENVGFQFDRWG